MFAIGTRRVLPGFIFDYAVAGRIRLDGPRGRRLKRKSVAGPGRPERLFGAWGVPFMRPVVRETCLEGLTARRGKVRDVYDLGDRILIVATDRISAYDVVMPTGIPDKGRILRNSACGGSSTWRT